MRFVKLYGMERSGLNYVRWLLEANFQCDVLTDILGWRHGPHSPQVDWTGKSWVDPSHDVEMEAALLVDMVSDDLREAVGKSEIAYLILTKNPYAWWASYTRHLQQVRSTADVNLVRELTRYERRHRSWLKLINGPTPAAIVPYEGLLAHFESYMDSIGHNLGLERERTIWMDTAEYMATRSDWNWKQGHTQKAFRRRRYYRDEEYLAEWTPAMFKAARGVPGLLNLMEKLGYAVEG